MRTRRIIAVVVAVAALPLVVLGLIDPLEGGIALLGAIALGLIACLLSRVPVPALAWIAAAVTVVIGAVTLAIAISGIPGDAPPVSDAVAPPLHGRLVVLNWLWRVGVLVTLTGAILYLVRLFHSPRPTVAKARR